MAYSDVYGVDYGPKYTCANCEQPSGMMGHSRGLGFSCERPAHLLARDAERRSQRDLWELQNRNLGDALYDLETLAARRTRREYQWSRLRTRYGVHIIQLCNPGNNRACWERVKGALKRRGSKQR